MTGDEVALTFDRARRGEILSAALERDHGPAEDERERLRRGRAKILKALADEKLSAGGRRSLELALTDNRDAEQQLDSILRQAVEQLHAERMAAIGEISNTIASNAEATAKALKFWTAALVFVTLVLAAATAVLVVATFQL